MKSRKLNRTQWAALERLMTTLDGISDPAAAGLSVSTLAMFERNLLCRRNKGAWEITPLGRAALVSGHYLPTSNSAGSCSRRKRSRR